VVGSDVYVAGYEINGSVYTATYWKNGQATPLIEATRDTWVESIAVVDSRIYATGRVYNGFVYAAQYWKNGQAISLTDGLKDAYGTGIAVALR